MKKHCLSVTNADMNGQPSGQEKPSRINILQVQIGDSTFTGISNYLYQQYKAIDPDKIHYDFLFTNQNSLIPFRNDPIFAGSVFYTLEARIGKDLCNNYMKITRSLRKILRENHYDIVVVNSSHLEIAAACAAALTGIKDIVFITHAHNAGFVDLPMSLRTIFALPVRLIDAYCRRVVLGKSAYLFACTDTAGRYTFGDRAIHQPNYIRIRNAIHPKPFQPDTAIRKRVRNESGAGKDTLIFGGGGRLVHSKNLGFLLRVFDELRQIHPDSRLWLLGNGNDQESLIRQARALGLSQQVVFLGLRMDVPDLMQAMDAFVFPSLSEGLGIIAIEAQAAGLPTIISDGVPDDTLITPQAGRVPLSASPEEWAKAILAQIRAFPDRTANAEAFSRSGYDIADEAGKITDLYIHIAAETQPAAAKSGRI